MSTGYPNRWGSGVAVGVGVGGTTKVTCPIAFTALAFSVNQRLPSDPLAMPTGTLLAVGIGYSLMLPAGVLLPVLFAVALVFGSLRLRSVALAMGSVSGPVAGISD